MGTPELFFCMFLGHFIAAQSVLKKQHGRFFHDVPGFFDNIRPFPFERNLDFIPRDTVLSLLPFWSPDFHRLEELPPITIIPGVEVLCNESKLTLLVGKSSNGLVLTGEEIQLGDGCYSNGELPNKFVFTYSLDECGTTYVMQNGMPRVTNILYFKLKKAPSTWWKTPTTVHISCSPKRSYPYYNSMTFPENGKTFNIKAMNPSWTSAAVSNVYGRGQVVNLQVSARTRPALQQQLFIQSCFVSGSPEPQTRPRHAVIMNKGCTAPLGSPHVVVQFVASKGADVVNFVLNTAYLISELYIHCSVLISDQGPNFGSKSCNYDVLQSRWEDLTGNVEVCECCSSKCIGLSVRHLPQDAKAIISTGPLVIVDKPIVTSSPSISELQETSSPPVNEAMLSDRAATEDTISGSSVSTPPGVVVVSQDAVVKLNLWLPGQVQDAEHSEKISSESEDNLSKLQARDTVSNHLSLQPSNMHQEYLVLTNDIGDLSANELGSDGHMDLNLLTLVDGWAIPPRTEKEAFAEESQGKLRFQRSAMSETEAPQGVALPLTVGMNINVLKQNGFNQMIEEQAEAAVMSQEEANDVQPIIHSKLEFSKSTDGSQTLSYEEEVKQDRKGVLGRNGMRRNPEPSLRRLHSTFLAWLRRMDRAE